MKENVNITLIINPGSGVPIYRQIVEQVTRQVLSSRLKEGMIMPSVRSVASEFQINPMTVSKAYNLLEERNILERVRGVGMRILKKEDNRGDNSEKLNMIRPSIKEIVIAAGQLKISKQELKNEIDKSWEINNG